MCTSLSNIDNIDKLLDKVKVGLNISVCSYYPETSRMGANICSV